MRRCLLALSTLLVLVAQTLTAPSAGASTWSWTAPPDPQAGYGDIVRASVTAAGGRVRLRLDAGLVPYQTVVFIDVDADRLGPEFTAYRFSDGDGFEQRMFVYRSRDWTGYSDDTRCSPRTARVSADGRTLVAGFALRCLGYRGALPTRMRVAVHTRDDGVGIDWAPGPRRTFGRWFTVG